MSAAICSPCAPAKLRRSFGGRREESWGGRTGGLGVELPGKSCSGSVRRFPPSAPTPAGLGAGLGDPTRARDPLGKEVISLEGVGSVGRQPLVSSARGLPSSDTPAEGETEARRKSSFPVPKQVGVSVTPSPGPALPRLCPPALPLPPPLLLSQRIRAAFWHCAGSAGQNQPFHPPPLVPERLFPALHREKGPGYLPAVLLRIWSPRGTPWW